MIVHAADGTSAKDAGQEQTSEQLSTETPSEGKDFSPDKVFKAHETHSLSLDMSATQQGMQGDESSGRWSSSLGLVPSLRYES